LDFSFTSLLPIASLLEWSRHLQGPNAKNHAKSLISKGFPAPIRNFLIVLFK